MARIRDAVNRGVPVFVMDRDGVSGMERVLEDKSMEQKMYKASAVCKVARLMGIHVGDERNQTSRFTRYGRVISSSEEVANTRAVDLVRMVDAKEVIYGQLGLVIEEKEKL
jgi:hypothetical protein